MMGMHVAKLGEENAVRLPDEVVEALGLKQGDEVSIRITGPREIEIGSNRRLTREEALERIRAANWPLPPDYKFNREELHER
jgi:antitoxin MazE